MRALSLTVIASLAFGCARVWGFEEPTLDAGQVDGGLPPVVREPCFEPAKRESRACEGGDSSRICTPDGWSSWSACAAPGFRDMPPAPIEGRMWHSIVWTGEEVIVWGGRGATAILGDGAAYDPVKNSWRVLAPAPLAARVDHTAVWTGKEMLVWGGRLDATPATSYFADGATYDPRTNTWERLPGSPMNARARTAGVWSTTTQEVLLWGGVYEFDFYADDGGAFDPATRKWTFLTTTTAAPRAGAPSFWDGSRMLLVGGECKGADTTPCNDVWAHEPAGGAWERLTKIPAFYLPNSGQSFAATATTAAVFGGEKNAVKYGNGALFDVSSKSFVEIPAPATELGPKPGRTSATAFFADNKLWIHGGFTGDFDDHSATYDPAAGAWAVVETGLGPRMAATPVSSHDDTFVWGGRREGVPPEFFQQLNDGRILRHAHAP